MIWYRSFEFLVLILCPPLICFSFIGHLKKQVFSTLPLLIVFSVGFSALLSALLYPYVEYGWAKYWLITLFANIGAVTLMKVFDSDYRNYSRRIFNLTSLAFLAILAVVCLLDTGFILSKQGFSLLDGQSYFRPPLSNDLERHTLVINALLRHDGSPFIPQTEFLYQLFWHHWGAVFVALFPEGDSRYPLITALTLATGFLFFWTMLHFLYRLRFVLFLRKRLLFFILPILFFHADIYNFVCSLLFQAKPGIEADWSFSTPVFFRCFTLKLVSLTAPQHGIFLMFLCVFLSKQKVFSKLSLRSAIIFEFFSFVFCFLASPLMSGFFFLIYGILEVLKSVRVRGGILTIVLKWSVFLGIAFIIFRLAYHFWPQELVLRPGTSELEFLPRNWRYWVIMPFMFLGTSGTLGILIPCFLIWPRVKLDTQSKYYALLLVFLSLIFHYGVTDIEIRRHCAILMSFLGSVFVVLVFPKLKGIFRTQVESLVRPASLSIVILTFLLQAYFLYSYVGKPSFIDPSIPWRDYLALNRILKTKYYKIPVIGLSDPNVSGLEYPLAQEVTTSFSIPAHTVIHTKLTWDQFRLLRRIMHTGESLPHAGKLGYQYIVWGPVEEKIWGERHRKRFLSVKNLVEQVGSVSLYRYADNLRAQFESEKDTDSPQFYLKVADTFASEGWNDEALGYYFQAIHLQPDFKEAHRHLAAVLGRVNRIQEMEVHEGLGTEER